MRLREIEKVLGSVKLIVDTREQNRGSALERYQQRIESTGLIGVRKRLPIGDYSSVVLMDNKPEFLGDRFCIERKADLSEMAATMTTKKLRSSFMDHVKYAHEHGMKYYLIIEDATYNELLEDDKEEYVRYTKYKKSLLYEELVMLQTMYNVHLILIPDHKNTGKIIGDIVKKETKEEVIARFAKDYAAIMSA